MVYLTFWCKHYQKLNLFWIFGKVSCIIPGPSEARHWSLEFKLFLVKVGAFWNEAALIRPQVLALKSKTRQISWVWNDSFRECEAQLKLLLSGIIQTLSRLTSFSNNVAHLNSQIEMEVQGWTKCEDPWVSPQGWAYPTPHWQSWALETEY